MGPFGIALGSQKTHFENVKPKFCVDKKKKIWFAKFFYLQKSRFENKT
jgi:hypothetical protein